jgi:hypothetical protein
MISARIPDVIDITQLKLTLPTFYDTTVQNSYDKALHVRQDSL